MDSLSHLLALLAPRCEVNLHCRFGGRWQAGHQQMRSGVVPWHVVLRGEGRLNVGGQTHHLRAGDVVPPAARFAASDGEPGGVGPGAAGGAPV